MGKEIKKSNISSRFNPELVNVVTTGGQHILYMPSGENIKYPVWTRVMDEAGEQPYVIAKLLCNLLEQKDVPDYPDPYDKIKDLESELRSAKQELKYVRENVTDSINTAILSMKNSEIEYLKSRKWYHLLFGI